MPAVHQPLNLQIHLEDSHLWSKSSLTHRHQGEVKALKDLLSTSLFRLSFRRLRQVKEWGGICSGQKLTLIRMVTRVQATEHPYETFTCSIHPAASVTPNPPEVCPPPRRYFILKNSATLDPARSPSVPETPEPLNPSSSDRSSLISAVSYAT